MVSKAEAQRRYQEERTVSAGPDADTHQRRDAALRREQEKKDKARLESSARTHTFNEPPPTTATDAQMNPRPSNRA
jgi:hypothetical protein